jgi:hypothetical protein
MSGIEERSEPEPLKPKYEEGLVTWRNKSISREM